MIEKQEITYPYSNTNKFFADFSDYGAKSSPTPAAQKSFTLTTFADVQMQANSGRE
jgi:hypothetical protein